MDETKKALLSIELDTTALTQNAEKAKESVATLTSQLNTLKAAGKDSGEAFDKVVEQLKKAGEAADKSKEALKDFTKGLTDSNKAAGDLKAATADLSAQQQKNTQDATSGAASLDILKLKYAASKNEVSALRVQYKELEEQSKTLKETHSKNSTEVTTLKANMLELSAQIKNARANSAEYGNEIDKLNQSQKTSAQAVADNTAVVTKQDKAVTDSGKSIADYTEKTLKTSQTLFPFSKSVGEAAAQFNSFKDYTTKAGTALGLFKTEGDKTVTNAGSVSTGITEAAKSITTLTGETDMASGGFRNLGKAIAGTGIGLILIAINFLIDYFSKLKPVADLVEQAMAGFNGAMDAGKHIIDNFFTSIKSVGDLLGKLGNVIMHPIDALKSLGNAMADAAIKTAKLKKEQQDLDEQVQASVVKNAEAEAKIADLKVKMLTASLAQRQDYQKQIKALQDGETENHKLNVEKQVQISVNKVAAIAGITNTEIGDINKLDEKKIESLALSKHLNDDEVKSLREAVKQMADLHKEESETIIKNFTTSQNSLQSHISVKQTTHAKYHKQKEKDHQTHVDTIEATTAKLNVATVTDAGKAASIEGVIAGKALSDQKDRDNQSQQSTKLTFRQEFNLIDEKAKRYAAGYSKIASLFGKNTQAAKAAFIAKKAIAVAEIAIDTEQQVSDSISATKSKVKADAKLGFPIGTLLAAVDIAMGIADVASTIQNGVKQAATINSTNVQGFARGGMYLSDGYGTYLSGPGNGTSDSINAKLSNGESIINARSTQMYAPVLSAINQAGGGRAFNTPGNGSNYALGGIFSGSNSLNDSSADLANTRALNDMAKTMAANMPRQILVVEDVQASLQNKAMLQSMSNF